MAEEKADSPENLATGTQADPAAVSEDLATAGEQSAQAQSTTPETPESEGPGAAVEGDQRESAEPLEANVVSIAAEELERLHGEIEQARDAALRAQAEAQNAKRRAEQEAEKARKFALERFCNELLPVVDNLERALESASVDNEALKPIAEGVELTLKSFIGALSKFNVEAVDPHGEPFDPNLHQAMSLVENPEVDPNSVIAVMQKGYTLNGRLLRPAMVMVSKAPAA